MFSRCLGNTDPSQNQLGCRERTSQKLKEPKLRTGIALSVFVLSVVLALATVPGGMGVAGHLLGTTFMTQIPAALTLPGVIAMSAVGGTAGLVAFGTFVWLVIEGILAYRRTKHQSDLSEESSESSSSEPEEETNDVVDFTTYKQQILANNGPLLGVSNTGDQNWHQAQDTVPEGQYTIILVDESYYYVYGKRNDGSGCEDIWVYSGGDQDRHNALVTNSLDAALDWIETNFQDLTPYIPTESNAHYLDERDEEEFEEAPNLSLQEFQAKVMPGSFKPLQGDTTFLTETLPAGCYTIAKLEHGEEADWCVIYKARDGTTPTWIRPNSKQGYNLTNNSKICANNWINTHQNPTLQDLRPWLPYE